MSKIVRKSREVTPPSALDTVVVSDALRKTATTPPCLLRQLVLVTEEVIDARAADCLAVHRSTTRAFTAAKVRHVIRKNKPLLITCHCRYNVRFLHATNP